MRRCNADVVEASVLMDGVGVKSSTLTSFLGRSEQ
jgi:hypothetical protein